jgi:hypothetical protein
MPCSTHPDSPRLGRFSCAECRRIYLAAWKLRNRERRLSYHRGYNAANRERRKAYMRQWHDANTRGVWGRCVCGSFLPPPPANDRNRRVWFCSRSCRDACTRDAVTRMAAALASAGVAL